MDNAGWMDWRNRDLYLIFTPSLCVLDPWATLAESLAAGVELVQWRATTADRQELERCALACAEHSVPLIVNDDVRTAATCPGVAGAHVGQDDMAPELARATLRPDQVLGISSHDLAQARQAVAAGADCIGIGPCYATSTKGYQAGLPSSTLTAVFENIAVPTYAIGGINPDRVRELRKLGCRRVAVSQTILGSPKPGRAVERLLTALRG